jgi:DNA-binding Lrp family transcriptional regulator
MPDEELGLTNREKLVLKELSANSRISLTRLATVAGCSAVKASRLLSRLVTKLDIRFTLEVDMSKLGFEEKHVILVRFGKKPDENFLRNFFKDDPYVQNAYITKGDFDLFIFAASDRSSNYYRWETNLAAGLSEYLPELRPSSYVQAHLGYMPLNSDFVNFIKEEIRVDKTDRQILQLLNENSRMNYRDMSKRLGINEDTIRYRVFKLLRKGIISRFTIAIQKAGGSLIFFFARYRFDKNTLSDVFPMIRKHDMSEIEEIPLVNTTPAVIVLSGSYRFFALTFGRTKEEALNFGVRWYSNLLRNNSPHIVHAAMVKPVKGLLPLRNLDAKTYYREKWS